MANVNFDGIDWLNNRFQHIDVDFAQLRHVLSFSLLWNLFETKACSRQANPTSIRNSVNRAESEGRLHRDKYAEYIDYFSNRYLGEGGLGLDGLGIANNNHRQTVERTLAGELQDLNNIVYALLLIAHRVRNNLFHGNKDIESLDTQTELFHIVNNLLADYIEDITNVG